MSSIYVHIPFCARKCLYCDFYSVEDPGGIEPFLGALDREVVLARDRLPDLPVQTVFLGGGTPSILAPAQIARVLTTLRGAFSIAADAEITIEANPGTVTVETLAAYRAAGINRLSLGIQSFDDAGLRLLGRIHTSADARRAIEDARSAGFTNVGLDLILAVPGQTAEGWERTLREAIARHPEHVSAYALTVERHTPLGAAVSAGRLRPAPTELEAVLFERTMDVLEAAGYEHYEVSNYARPGFRCRHNMSYWSHGNYLGLGPSAHSFVGAADGLTGRRWWNVSKLAGYRKSLENRRLPIGEEEELGPKDLLAERLLLALRCGGLDLAALPGDVSTDLRDELGRLREQGLLAVSGTTVSVTRKGFLVCDELVRRLLPR